MWLGKIIGLIIGYNLGGTFGALLGLLVGHFFDVWRQYQRGGWFGLSNARHTTSGMQDVFLATTFQVMGHIAKADGHISEDELQAARQVMGRMRLNETQRLNAMQQFTAGKAAEFKLDTALTQLLRVSHHNPFLLRIFVDMQVQAAQLSGAISPAKQHILDHLFQRIGYAPFTFHFQQGHASHSRQQYYQRHTTSHTTASEKLMQAYHLLGIASTATATEIKSAYRRLISKHHPDKLIAQGVSEAMIKMATEKAQEIQLAYDLIRQHRQF